MDGSLHALVWSQLREAKANEKTTDVCVQATRKVCVFVCWPRTRHRKQLFLPGTVPKLRMMMGARKVGGSRDDADHGSHGTHGSHGSHGHGNTGPLQAFENEGGGYPGSLALAPSLPMNEASIGCRLSLDVGSLDSVMSLPVVSFRSPDTSCHPTYVDHPSSTNG